MFDLTKKTRGFTLIEILIALALLAIIAAVVVPNVTGYLGRGEEQAYKADKKVIQGAVDAYYADPANRVASGLNKGKKAYPIKGGTGNTDKVLGGAPVWNDTTANGTRDVGEDWKTVDSIDTESYFINFTTLVTGKYLNDVPTSASLDNTGGATGSYGWYVDANGKVESAYYYEFTPTTGVVKTGFQTGVYP